MTPASLPPESLQLHVKQSGRLMAAGAGAVRRIPAGFMEPMAWAAKGRGPGVSWQKTPPTPAKEGWQGRAWEERAQAGM